MKRRITYLFILMLLAGAAGCMDPFLAHRRSGFDSFSKAVASLHQDPELYKVIRIKEIVVIIVGDRKFFAWDKAREDYRIAGYAVNNQIRVFGYMRGDKIVLNEAVLGHELMHLLQFTDGSVADPDKLDP